MKDISVKPYLVRDVTYVSSVILRIIFSAPTTDPK